MDPMTILAIEASKRVAELLFRGRDGEDANGEGKPARADAEQAKREGVVKLLASGIDPLVFDALLSNEIDRKLKTTFGAIFVGLTVLFTAVSYGIIGLSHVCVCRPMRSLPTRWNSTWVLAKRS